MPPKARKKGILAKCYTIVTFKANIGCIFWSNKVLYSRISFFEWKDNYE